YPESERLVSVYVKSMAQTRTLDLLTVPEYLEWKEKNATLGKFAGYRWTEEHVSHVGEKLEKVKVAPVTAELFSVLRVEPALGRNFSKLQAENEYGAVILTEECWRKLFGSATDLGGKSIRLENEWHPVIGVLPAGFAFEYLWKVDAFSLAEFSPETIADR